MEQKLFFLFNIVKGQDNELQMVTQKSFFYEALNIQAKEIRKYAATKGLILRTHQNATVNTTHLKNMTDETDQDKEHESETDSTSTKMNNSPKQSPEILAAQITQTKRKISQNRSVQTDNVEVKGNSKPTKRHTKKHHKN